MGCDYYKDVYIRIVYISDGVQKEAYIQVDHHRCYITGGEFTLKISTISEYVIALQQRTPLSHIYLESRWLCLPDRVPYYKDIISTISEVYELVSVQKVTYFKERQHTKQKKMTLDLSK